MRTRGDDGKIPHCWKDFILSDDRLLEDGQTSILHDTNEKWAKIALCC